MPMVLPPAVSSRTPTILLKFARVLENFEQTTTLRLEGPDWDNTLVRNCKVHDTAQVFNNSLTLAFGTYPMEVIQ